MAQSHRNTAVIVLPTYNEAGNIGELLERLLKVINESVWNIQILVVDDCSPDGTGEIVKEFTHQHPDQVFLTLNHDKRGIGYAYKIGYDIAINQMKADVIIEMDADLQHPPEQVPDLLCRISEGYDFVIGSRKINGGENSIVKRGLWRYLLTVIGGLVIRLALFWPTRYFKILTDPTSGFRATRVKGYAECLDFDHMVSWSFPYKYDLLYQLGNLDAMMTEIPLRFKGRTYGESKMAQGAIREALESIFRIRLARN
jgi:dolichol-phosphate mannosyltransferase